MIINRRVKYLWNTERRWISLRRTIRKMLQFIFKYSDWHIYPPNEKEYLRYIWNWTEDNEKELVGKNIVEVGCGLGDLIGNIEIDCRKYGYDIEHNTIVGARFFHRKIQFSEGTIEDVRVGEIEVVIMVNWEDGIKPMALKNSISTLLDNNRVNYFIVDKYIISSQSYKYTHDWNELLDGKYNLLCRSKGYISADKNRRFIEIWKRIENE